jgi:hypothetical protein
VFAGTLYVIRNWLGIPTAFQNDGLPHLDQSQGLIGNGRVFASRLGVIWFACIWSIWKARNDKLFKNKEVCLENIVESVKRSSWY